jgi:hypothetical protein
MSQSAGCACGDMVLSTGSQHRWWIDQGSQAAVHSSGQGAVGAGPLYSDPQQGI